MKKLAILAAVAVFGSFAWNASALSSGYESFNFSGTLWIQSSEYGITKVKVSNKDILSLIEDEFGVTFPSGAVLVTYGMGSWDDVWYGAEFLVLAKDGTVLLDNANEYDDFDDDYELGFVPDGDSYVIEESGDSDTYTYYFDSAEFFYENYDDDYYFYLDGSDTDKIDYDNDDESFSMTCAEGEFYLYVDGDIEGNIEGKASGSGKDVEYYDY